MITPLFNAAGGLAYHLKAQKFQATLWASFQQQIYQWLRAWPVESKKIILVGASAGYMLPVDWLKQFDSIVLIEPDRLARQFFKKKFKPRSIAYDNGKFFIKGSHFKRLHQANLIFNHRYNDHAVLFCNFLGQLMLLFKEQQAEADLKFWSQNLVHILKNKEWASFHDFYSSPLAPAFVLPLNPSYRLSDDNDILKTFFQPDQRGEVIDHRMNEFFSSWPPTDFNNIHYFNWNISPNYWHIIEAFYSKPARLRVEA